MLALLGVPVLRSLVDITRVSRNEGWILATIPPSNLGSNRFLKSLPPHGIHHFIQCVLVTGNKGALRTTITGEGFHKAIVVSIHKGFDLKEFCVRLFF